MNNVLLRSQHCAHCLWLDVREVLPEVLRQSKDNNREARIVGSTGFAFFVLCLTGGIEFELSLTMACTLSLCLGFYQLTGKPAK